jgi:hypothetical protein
VVFVTVRSVTERDTPLISSAAAAAEVSDLGCGRIVGVEVRRLLPQRKSAKHLAHLLYICSLIECTDHFEG